MNRLDNVVGPEGWSDEYVETKDGLMCRLTITLPDGRTVTKSDGGGFAGMSDSDDDEKSAFSSAFKRVGVKFGIGRELYRDGMPEYVNGAPSQARPAPTDGHPRPEHAETIQGYGDARRERQGGGNGNGNGGGDKKYGPPKTGRHLFAFCMNEKDRGVDALKAINGWAKDHGIRGKMTEWADGQAQDAYHWYASGDADPSGQEVLGSQVHDQDSF